MSIDAPWGPFTLPPLTTLRPVTKAASRPSTVTLVSATSHDSAVRLPACMSARSWALVVVLPSGRISTMSSASTSRTASTSLSLRTRGQSFSILINSASIAALSGVGAGVAMLALVDAELVLFCGVQPNCKNATTAVTRARKASVGNFFMNRYLLKNELANSFQL